MQCITYPKKDKAAFAYKPKITLSDCYNSNSRISPSANRKFSNDESLLLRIVISKKISALSSFILSFFSSIFTRDGFIFDQNITLACMFFIHANHQDPALFIIGKILLMVLPK